MCGNDAELADVQCYEWAMMSRNDAAQIVSHVLLCNHTKHGMVADSTHKLIKPAFANDLCLTFWLAPAVCPKPPLQSSISNQSSQPPVPNFRFRFSYKLHVPQLSQLHACTQETR